MKTIHWHTAEWPARRGYIQKGRKRCCLGQNGKNSVGRDRLSCICGDKRQPDHAPLFQKSQPAGLGGTLLGIGLLQVALLACGWDKTLVLTLLPLTAYLPAIVCLHILSRSGFFQTVAAWTVGTIVYFVLKTIWKILMLWFTRLANLPGWGRSLLLTACLLLAAGGMLFLVFRFLRRPFRTYVLHNQTNWLLISFPVLMIILLFSYVGGSTTDNPLLVLLLLTACSIFLVLVRVLASASTIARLREAERAVSLQMAIQRREYEDVCKKMELGRTYRHDMRHHLLVLEGLAEQQDNPSITRYIQNLSGQLSAVEKETYCENPTVNAVLSSCIGQAREAGCSVTAQIRLPRELPFDEIDICVVLANALENAANACRKWEKENRYIRLSAELTEERRLIIAVENPCPVPVAFDADGFPAVPQREGHGIGLRSIDAVTRKYNGLFRCTCEEGEFRFKAVLFRRQVQAAPAAVPGRKKRLLSKRLASSALLPCSSFSL